jgi:GT2 family glycosyltransferase
MLILERLGDAMYRSRNVMTVLLLAAWPDTKSKEMEAAPQRGRLSRYSWNAQKSATWGKLYFLQTHDHNYLNGIYLIFSKSSIMKI